jgi:tetratricopeptide (TPR) repeat protein
MEIGKDDAVALCTAGMALGYVVENPDDGERLIERSIALDPNFALSWLFNAWTKVWLGKPDQALECVQRAMRMSPQDPQFFNMRTATGWAHLQQGRYEEAQEWARSALNDQPAATVSTDPGLTVARKPER